VPRLLVKRSGAGSLPAGKAKPEDFAIAD